MIELLNDAERIKLPIVISKRSRFQRIIGKSVENINNIFSNCILLQGKAGSGKTTLVVNYLDNLKREGVIGDYTRAAGHITPQSLYRLLRGTADYINGAPQILILDDCDCLADQGCLELMKAAFDTKSNSTTNRQVYYMTDSSTGFKYNGFCIIITNNEFKPERTTVHQQALLDRVQPMSIDLEANDMMIYTSYLVEKFLNDNEDNLSDDEIKEATDLFNNEIRTWMAADAFRKAGINFSIRLMKKFIDASRIFKEDWKDYSTQYQRLSLACDINESEENTIEPTINSTIPAYINPRTMKPYASTKINKLKKEGILPKDFKIAI